MLENLLLPNARPACLQRKVPEIGNKGNIPLCSCIEIDALRRGFTFLSSEKNLIIVSNMFPIKQIKNLYMFDIQVNYILY